MGAEFIENTSGTVDTGGAAEGAVDFDMAGALGEMEEKLGFVDEVEEGASTPAEGPQNEEPPAEETQKEPTEEEPPADEPPPAETVDAPSSWRKESKALWAQVPPLVQQEVLKREQDMLRGLEQYKTAAEIGRQAERAIGQGLEVYQRYGANPFEQVSALVQTHTRLLEGSPAERAAILQGIARQYGVDFSSMSQDQSAPTVDPAVSHLHEKVSTLESQLRERQLAEEQFHAQQAASEVQAFAADPKNIYFSELTQEMQKLLTSEQASTLQEAYEQAIWLNPVTREKETARLLEARRAEAAAKAAAAKKTQAARTSVEAKPGRLTTPGGDLQSDLESIYDTITQGG